MKRYWLVRRGPGPDFILFPQYVVGQDGLPFDDPAAKPFETRRDARMLREGSWAYGGAIEIWEDARIKAQLTGHSLAGHYEENWSVTSNWPPSLRKAPLAKPVLPL